MSKLFYPKLAATNMKKNSKVYFPYILTCIITIAMYYILSSLSQNKSLANLYGGPQLIVILSFGMVVLALFSAVFLFYTHSFLIKRRKKEFGIYNILGMEKRHIFRVMFFETLYTALISIIIGIISGIVLSKLSFLLLLRILDYKAGTQVPIEYEFSLHTLMSSIVFFGILFLLILLYTFRQIHLSKPIELLKGGQAGEKEPKTKWITAVIGVLTMGSGYFIALTTESPLEAIPLFMLAVVLVIIGTYCLFSAGSIAVLKILRKNKKYYYKTKHFTSVSGMLYRMKQNSVGLANICILSTAVIVMASGTISLYFGMDDVIRTRYPRNIAVVLDHASEEQVSEMDSLVKKEIDKYGVNAFNFLRERSYFLQLIRKENNFNILTESYYAAEVSNVYLMSLSDYNKMFDKEEALNDDEVLIQTINGIFPYDTAKLGEKTYKIKNFIQLDASNRQLTALMQTFYFILPDKNQIKQIASDYGCSPSFIDEGYYYLGFDTDADRDTQIELARKISELKDYCYVDGMEASREEFFSIYAAMFFIGIFLGMLFIIAAVLIIYYKQISEGHDDRERYIIMQKVGMSKNEVKSSIRSQVLTVFFLPLVMSCIHMAVAFPIIEKLLAILNLTNTVIFGCVTLGTILVFTLLYVFVYMMTAKVYYKIVSR